MERITRKQVVAVFERYAAAHGATIADPSWEITDPRRDGAWLLDHNGTYGGYCIRAYCTSSKIDGHAQTYTAQTDVTLSRMPARQFCEAMWMHLRVMGK